MRQFVRPVATALGIACLAVSMAILSTGGALAQAKQAPPAPAKQAAPAPAPEPEAKQIALTEKQIEGVLAAKKDFDAIGDKRPSDVPAELNAVAKKYGFASYADHETVVDNIKLVLAGVDPATKKYVGEEAVIKAGIARVQADKKMSAEDKKEALDELKEALKSPSPAVTFKANIDLVVKHYDKLAAALADDQ
ncbi:MAG TPA: hypothetical protein VD863_20275 [Bradyrhizobium sp.]|jgi:hypothetical protein|nr:hypothetical protein [Bradyrhizobium sp.]